MGLLSQASTALAPPRTTPATTSATATDSLSFGSTADPQKPPVPDSKETDTGGNGGTDNTMKLAVGFGVGLGVLFLAFLILAVVVLKRRKRKDEARGQTETVGLGIELLGWGAENGKVEQRVEAGSGTSGTVGGSVWSPHPSELEGSRVGGQTYELMGSSRQSTHG